MINKIATFFKSTCIVFFLSALISCDLSAQTSSAKYIVVSKVPTLLISVGDYEVEFNEKYSWTFREITYNKKKIISPTGAHQPVLKEHKVPVGIDNFLGTGHRPEQIDLVEILVLDQAGNVLETHPVDSSLDLKGSNTYIVRKKSKFQSEFGGLYYLHESKITISITGVKQEYSFEAVGSDYTNLDFMYAFMHCFEKTFSNWAVGDNSGVTEQGKFSSDGSFTLRKDIRFCLVHDPDQQVGISILYPEIYKGRGIKNAFWNRPRDNKHYLMVEPAKTKGEKFTYFAEIKAFDVQHEDDFVEKGIALIKSELH